MDLGDFPTKFALSSLSLLAASSLFCASANPAEDMDPGMSESHPAGGGRREAH